jgi:hypothetical protein
MRLPMDNPIFQKLQDIIERAPRTPQWFGMAEQAINTIYLLGEQPDQLCSLIIKNLTEKAFHPRVAELDMTRERATTPIQGEDGDTNTCYADAARYSCYTAYSGLEYPRHANGYGTFTIANITQGG